MNKKGFVTSALLYGILSLFLVLMLGTLSVISSRKLASDRLKESAINDVQDLKTNYNCFTIEKSGSTCMATGYDANTCGNTIAIDLKNINGCNKLIIKNDSIKNVSRGYIYIKSKIINPDEPNGIVIEDNAFKDNIKVTFIVNQVDKLPSGDTIWGAAESVITTY